MAKTTTSKISSPKTVVGKNVSTLSTKTIQSAVGAKADGSYGPQTTAAVKAFQKANGLTADGIVGAKTAAAIQKTTSPITSKTTTPLSIKGGGSYLSNPTPSTSINPASIKGRIQEQNKGLLGTFGKLFNSPILGGGINPNTNKLGFSVAGVNLGSLFPSKEKPTESPIPTTVISSSDGRKEALKLNGISTEEQKKIDEQKEKIRLQKEKSDAAKAEAARIATEKPVVPPPVKPLEEKILEAPAENMQKVYDLRTGEQSEIPIGKIPPGYSKQDPKLRTDVSDSITDEYGNVISRMSDGTYRRIDPAGNYSMGSEFEFTNAKRIQTVLKSLDAAVNGSYPLSESQLGQLESTKAQYQTLIKNQQVENKDVAGATTLAVNRWGLGDQLVGTGIIDKVVNDGMDRVVSLQNKMTSAVSEMRRGFEEDNIKKLRDAYDTFSDSQKKLQDNFDNIQKTIANAKAKQDTKNEADYLRDDNKYPDAGLLATDTPKERTEKILKSPTYLAEKAKRESGDPIAIAEAIMEGRMPPVFTGLYGKSAAVKSELARRGFDLSKATSDWNATQKYITSLNSTQQLRLRQAVDFTYESLDIVDMLAEKWNSLNLSGDYKFINKPAIKAAKQGLLGEDAQSVATQLDNQISDLVSELATVYKGGNSSTDQSLALSAEQLKSDWSYKTLTDNVNLIRKNLAIRKGSLASGAPSTIGGGNQYINTNIPTGDDLWIF